MIGQVIGDAGRVVRAGEHVARMAGARQRAEQRVADRAAELGQEMHAGTALAVPQPTVLAVPDATELLPQVLEEIGLYLLDYVSFPSRSALVASVLWIASAAARDQQRDLIWWAHPRLLATSAENGSGKSTLLDLIAVLLQSRAGRLVKVTPYGLAKILGAYKEVALPDDAQNVFGATGEAGKDVLNILLGSYSRGGTWVSGKSKGTIEPVYGAVALAGKDAVITKNADALADLLVRSVIVRFERAVRYMRQMDTRGAARGAQLAQSLAAVMAALHVQLLAAADGLAEESEGQIITEGDGGRTAQIWRPLDAVAAVAGGPWAQYGRQAREELAEASGDLMSAQDALADIVGARTEGRNFWDEAAK